MEFYGSEIQPHEVQCYNERLEVEPLFFWMCDTCTVEMVIMHNAGRPGLLCIIRCHAKPQSHVLDMDDISNG